MLLCAIIISDKSIIWVLYHRLIISPIKNYNYPEDTFKRVKYVWSDLRFIRQKPNIITANPLMVRIVIGSLNSRYPATAAIGGTRYPTSVISIAE